jgi:hypothetical protein
MLKNVVSCGHVVLRYLQYTTNNTASASILSEWHCEFGQLEYVGKNVYILRQLQIVVYLRIFLVLLQFSFFFIINQDFRVCYPEAELRWGRSAGRASKLLMIIPGRGLLLITGYFTAGIYNNRFNSQLRNHMTPPLNRWLCAITRFWQSTNKAQRLGCWQAVHTIRCDLIDSIMLFLWTIHS